MVYCTITLLLYGIVVLCHYYNMAIRHRREKEAWRGWASGAGERRLEPWRSRGFCL